MNQVLLAKEGLQISVGFADKDNIHECFGIFGPFGQLVSHARFFVDIENEQWALKVSRRRGGCDSLKSVHERLLPGIVRRLKRKASVLKLGAGEQRIYRGLVAVALDKHTATRRVQNVNGDVSEL